MTETFILQNQDNHFFGKNKEWVDGYDANAVYKTPYKDEAVNQKVEISAKDYQQRVKILSCELDEKGLPVIDMAIMPAPLPKAPKTAKNSDIPDAIIDLFAADAPAVGEDEDLEDVEIVDLDDTPDLESDSLPKPLP